MLGTFLAALKTVITNAIQTGGGGRLKLVSYGPKHRRVFSSKLTASYHPRSTPSISSCECLP